MATSDTQPPSTEPKWIPDMRECRWCYGTGYDDMIPFNPCPGCHGTGEQDYGGYDEEDDA